MRALHAYAKNDPSRLVFAEDAPLPTLAPGDVLLRVDASGMALSELEWSGTWINSTGAADTNNHAVRQVDVAARTVRTLDVEGV
jgi:hypothetical protein